ncbi:MAG: DUF1080 domain-containing protein [Candidatus Hydrogenedentes bacterium]|nr:DUF1080 domain-containing protein [Candidatus Hydrogenedentota bacterium]
MNLHRPIRACALFTLLFLALAPGVAIAETPFLGRWAVTPAAGGAGWLEVRNAAGYLEGTLLWMGGSPEVQTRVYLDGETLHGLRIVEEDVRDAAGAVVRKQSRPVSFSATLNGDELHGLHMEPSADGTVVHKQEFTAKRIPDLPAAPDLTQYRFGDPIPLFNGHDLEGWVVSGGAYWGNLPGAAPEGAPTAGWIPVEENVANGWSAQDGVLVNNPADPALHYGNIQTRRDFEDFNLSLEVNVGKDGNSGVYLRGIYEVQVRDSYGMPLDKHNMGGIYGRIAPTEAAEKPAGEWQTLDIILVERHVTVMLNGKTIIANQPLMGCTGGALWSDESKPGPIYLQGDHTGVQYRNIVLRPITK